MPADTPVATLDRMRVLAAWWDALVAADEVQTCFAAPPRTFAAFCDLMADRPVYAEYADDDDVGITVAAVLWGQPWLRGLKIGLWVAAPYRRTRAGLRMLEDLLGLAFGQYPVLIAMAADAPRGRLYQRYGFEGQTIPALGADGPVWLGWLTPARWRRRIGGVSCVTA